MNVSKLAKHDFHCVLLWCRALELICGNSISLLASELEMDDLFKRYRSPYKA